MYRYTSNDYFLTVSSKSIQWFIGYFAKRQRQLQKVNGKLTVNKDISLSAKICVWAQSQLLNKLFWFKKDMHTSKTEQITNCLPPKSS